MSKLREAAQALIDYDDAGPDDGKGGWLHWDAKFDALRAALAEPQEPVSTETPSKPTRRVTYVCPVCAASLERQE